MKIKFLVIEKYMWIVLAVSVIFYWICNWVLYYKSDMKSVAESEMVLTYGMEWAQFIMLAFYLFISFGGIAYVFYCVIRFSQNVFRARSLSHHTNKNVIINILSLCLWYYLIVLIDVERFNWFLDIIF
jgi:hypothetical protein